MKNSKLLGTAFMVAFVAIVAFVMSLTGGTAKPAATQDHSQHQGMTMPQSAPAQVTVQAVTINIESFAFSQPALTVARGTVVTWKNLDSVAHNAIGANGAFNSGTLEQNGTFTFTFNQNGTFNYMCDFHPGMSGVVTVVDPPVAIDIQGFAFNSNVVTIPVGTMVIWTNLDGAAHTATSAAENGNAAGAIFDSGNLAQNATFSFTFNTIGTYNYFCRRHPSMLGRIVVVDVPLATPTITSISPNSIAAGSPDFTLTVTGTNFVAESEVYWDGGSLSPPTFVSSTQLTVNIPSSLVAASGTSTVTVVSPGPGADPLVSNGLPFTITGDCNPMVVVSALDDNTCGTLRAALIAAAGDPSISITFDFTTQTVINITGSGLTVPTGVTIAGTCTSTGPFITINGAGVTDDGLTLQGNVNLTGIQVRGFAGRQIVATATNNTLQCVKASR